MSMKKTAIFLIAMLLAFVFSACTSSSLHEYIIGTWTYEKGDAKLVLTFENSSFVMFGTNREMPHLSDNYSGVYTVDEETQKIWLTFNDAPSASRSAALKYINGKLCLEADENIIFVK